MFHSLHYPYEWGWGWLQYTDTVRTLEHCKKYARNADNKCSHCLIRVRAGGPAINKWYIKMKIYIK